MAKKIQAKKGKEPSTKVCKTCGLEKPVSAFYPRRAECKSCYVEHSHGEETLAKFQAGVKAIPESEEEKPAGFDVPILEQDAITRAQSLASSINESSMSTGGDATKTTIEELIEVVRGLREQYSSSLAIRARASEQGDFRSVALLTKEIRGILSERKDVVQMLIRQLDTLVSLKQVEEQSKPITFALLDLPPDFTPKIVEKNIPFDAVREALGVEPTEREV